MSLYAMNQVDRVKLIITDHCLRNLAVCSVGQFLDGLHVAFLGFLNQLCRNCPKRFVVLARFLELHAERVTKRFFLFAS